MKKSAGKKSIKIFVFGIMFLLLMMPLAFAEEANFFEKIWNKITGKAVGGSGGPPEGASAGGSGEHTIGPSAEEQACMSSCMKCVSPRVNCTGNQEQCMQQCNAEKPEATEETSCMEKCVVKGCTEFDFSCQEKNKAVCEKECDMIKEPPAKSEEEQCIRDCVNAESPGLICKPGEGGEKGNELCQRCAKSCDYLYAGPCLTEMKLEAAKSTCNTCEHCYGEPVMGDSGEGYECIVGIECADASSEFGDEPGTGPGIGQEGYIAPNAVAGAVDGVIKFFKNIFGGGEKQETSESSNAEPIIESSSASE